MNEPSEKQDISFIDEIAEALAVSVSSVKINNEFVERCGDKVYQDNNSRTPSELIRQYNESIDAIKNNNKLGVLSKVLSENYLSPFLLQEILIGIVTTGFSADLPKEYHLLPEVRDTLARNLPIVDRALIGLATLLDSTNNEPENTLRQQIVNNKETIQHFQSRLLQIASKKGINPERLGRFESILTQVLWRVTKMSSSPLSARCVELIDKVGSRFGITPDLRRDICARLSCIDSYENGNALMNIMLDECASERILYGDFLKLTHKSIGSVLLGIGGRTLLNKAGSSNGIFLITGGVVALFLGLLVVIGLWIF